MASRKIGARWRGMISRRQYQKTRDATVKIQSSIRAFMTRRRTKPIIEERRRAALVIQCAIRKALAQTRVFKIRRQKRARDARIERELLAQKKKNAEEQARKENERAKRQAIEERRKRKAADFGYLYNRFL